MILKSIGLEGYEFLFVEGRNYCRKDKKHELNG